jgi:hypothetical protein
MTISKTDCITTLTHCVLFLDIRLVGHNNMGGLEHERTSEIDLNKNIGKTATFSLTTYSAF